MVRRSLNSGTLWSDANGPMLTFWLNSGPIWSDALTDILVVASHHAAVVLHPTAPVEMVGMKKRYVFVFFHLGPS